MWVSRKRYEELIQAEGVAKALDAQFAELRAQVIRERERADNAVDVLLMSKNAAPITPRPEPKPELQPFDEDPEELKRVLLDMGLNPVGTLMTEGIGDAK